jgi:hypothetical protein
VVRAMPIFGRVRIRRAGVCGGRWSTGDELARAEDLLVAVWWWLGRMSRRWMPYGGERKRSGVCVLPDCACRSAGKMGSFEAGRDGCFNDGARGASVRERAATAGAAGERRPRREERRRGVGGDEYEWDKEHLVEALEAA